MADTPAGRLYCLRCGHQAERVGVSMDARYPFVLCSYTNERGEPRGCGRQLGTADQGEAIRVVAEYHANRLRAEHPRHRTRSGFDARCPVCQTRSAHDRHLADRRPAADCADCRAAVERTTPTRALGTGPRP